eukprot:SAG31_NODE_19381_length_604_cov_0.813861_1_plen_143_part_00
MALQRKLPKDSEKAKQILEDDAQHLGFFVVGNGRLFQFICPDESALHAVFLAIQSMITDVRTSVAYDESKKGQKAVEALKKGGLGQGKSPLLTAGKLKESVLELKKQGPDHLIRLTDAEQAAAEKADLDEVISYFLVFVPTM